jgi:hypothetical protein
LSAVIRPRTSAFIERGSALLFDELRGLTEIAVRHDLQSAGSAEAYLAKIKRDGRVVDDLGAQISGKLAGVRHRNTPRTNRTDFARPKLQVSRFVLRDPADWPGLPRSSTIDFVG